MLVPEGIVYFCTPETMTAVTEIGELNSEKKGKQRKKGEIQRKQEKRSIERS